MNGEDLAIEIRQINFECNAPGIRNILRHRDMRHRRPASAGIRHPLLRAANALLLRDETLHAQLGWLYLDWIGETLDDAERARLAAAAEDQMSRVAAAGGDETASPEVRRRLADHVVAPLARHGILSSCS